MTRPLFTEAERPVVIPVWLNTIVAKLDDVDTTTLYFDAPVAELQLRVSEVGWLIAPFVGNARDGTAGSVVKLQPFDHELPASLVLTLQ